MLSVARGKGKKGDQAATVTISTLPGITKSFKSVDLAATRPRQLWDSVRPPAQQGVRCVCGGGWGRRGGAPRAVVC